MHTTRATPALCALLLGACALQGAPTPPVMPSQDWPDYLGDPGRAHRSTLAQIHRGNVDRLELAWSYDTGPLQGALSQIQCSPIVVGGVLYGTTPRSHPFALDAATWPLVDDFVTSSASGPPGPHNSLTTL